MSLTSSAPTRRERVERLLALRQRVDNEISQIEAEITAEIEAMRRAKTAAVKAKQRVGRRPAALCGTEGGYYRHRRTLSEDACDACKLAHRVAESERANRRREVA